MFTIIFVRVNKGIDLSSVHLYALLYLWKLGQLLLQLICKVVDKYGIIKHKDIG